jgi:hypothetical protein
VKENELLFRLYCFRVCVVGVGEKTRSFRLCATRYGIVEEEEDGGRQNSTDREMHVQHFASFDMSQSP